MELLRLVAFAVLLCLANLAAASDIHTGGRLFDNWYQETGVDFVPDDPDTPEPDGDPRCGAYLR